MAGTHPGLPAWNLTRVTGLWRDMRTGALLEGKVRVTIPVRLSSALPDDETVIPAGVYFDGPLNTTAGSPSLDIEVPATDDPDIRETGWKVTVEVTFTGGYSGERYVLDVPVAADRVRLKDVALPAVVPPQSAMLKLGLPGGVALVSADGASVVDADGNPLTTGDVDLTGYATTEDVQDATTGLATEQYVTQQVAALPPAPTWDTLNAKPTVIAAGATPTAARAAIGAGTGTVKQVGSRTPDATGKITLDAADVGARPASWLPTVADIGAQPAGNYATLADVAAAVTPPALPTGVPTDTTAPAGTITVTASGTYMKEPTA